MKMLLTNKLGTTVPIRYQNIKKVSKYSRTSEIFLKKIAHVLQTLTSHKNILM